MTPTRGERNNNPGNIDRNATKWQGMAEDQPDSRFIKFSDPVWGIRAIAKVLLTYQNKHGLKTVSEIINRWAPPVENNTDSYVRQVCKGLGCGPDAEIDLTDRIILQDLVTAIIRHENGRVAYPEETIAEGVDRALA